MQAPSDSTFPFGLLLSGTPLREAVVKGSIPVVRLLLEAGADPNAYGATMGVGNVLVSSRPLQDAVV